MRFLMLGGFLGAGKTTTIARLARRFEAHGKKTAIITNDKASELVDTLNLRAQGFHVGELPGVCFCGNVDELVGMINALGTAYRPDVVMAEPVGSCLDIVATVIRPLRTAYGDRFEIAHYGVLVKPTHATKILRGEENAGFSPKAAYLFRKQLEEADFIMLNRVDQLSPQRADEIETLLREQYPDRPIVRMSATTGEGFEAAAALFDQVGEFGRRIIELDYDAYGAGEAELGWLNADMMVRRDRPFVLDDFLLAVVGAIRDRLNAIDAEASHLKVIGIHGGRFGVANLISTSAAPELSRRSDAIVEAVRLVVNARIKCPPSDLRRAVAEGLQAAATEFACKLERLGEQCFRPGVASG